MKNSVLFLAIAAVLFVSCDMAKYPIDDLAVNKVDARFLGEWRVKSKDGHEVYTLTKQNEYKYLITYKDKDKKKLQKLPAFLSEVNKTWFLNVYYTEDTVKGYFFMRIVDVNKEGNKVWAVMVKDSLLSSFKSPAEVRAEISRNMNNPTFYSDTSEFDKMK